MKEIKFRVFDTGDKVMVELEEYYPYIGCASHLVGIGKDRLFFEERCPDCSGGIEAEEISDTWKVMWSTGIRDKNGKEIYEGDIVRSYGDDFYEEGVTEEVYYDEGCLRFCLRGDGCGCMNRLVESEVEVLGNIYENPELLKETNK